MLLSPFRIWFTSLPFILALIFLGGFIILFGVREIEKNDPFCGSCHMNDHGLKLQQSLASEAETLSAFHRIDGAVRCIDCHGYDSFTGRLETMFLAAKSLFHYVVGDFEDPSRTTEPIRDESCVKCHPSDRPRSSEDEFHSRFEHMDLPVPCVNCHTGHKPGINTQSYLVKKIVLNQCSECHPERGE
jgi:nitrate/TMAO reductase-like tetraheme cytochrome c subunit